MTKIPTDYFGPYVYADLSCPPILMLLAGNSKIKDPALKSRFNVINFPLPKKSSLVRLAKKMFDESAKELEMGSLRFTKVMEKYIETLQTYREVEEAVPGLIQKAPLIRG